MGAANTALYDLIELQGLLENTTYTTTAGGGGDIIGAIDTATYTDSHTGNSGTNITEINETFDADNGVLTIDGVDYNIEIVTPTNSSNPVTVTYDNGASSIDLVGDDGTSQVAFVVADPLGGGTTRWFMAIDDAVGDLDNITAIQTRSLNYNPAGDDVQIDLDLNNLVTACFVAGTLIATPGGPRRADALAPGDWVQTLDHGPRKVLWTYGETLRFGPGGAGENQRPVLFAPGALGPGLPGRTLSVSPQHRMLVASPVAARLTGSREVLVPAVKLAGLDGIERDFDAERVTYVHVFLGSHEIVWAEGAPCESFLPERQALRGVSPASRRQLRALTTDPVTPARPIVETGGQLRALIGRHIKHARPLCDLGRGATRRRKPPQADAANAAIPKPQSRRHPSAFHTLIRPDVGPGVSAP